MPSETPLEREFALAFQRRLRDLREAAGLTQEEAAERVGVSRNHYQVWESGYSDRAKHTPPNPRLLNLFAMADAFGVEVTDIVAELPRPRRTVATG